MKTSNKNKYFFGHAKDFNTSDGYFLGQFMGNFKKPVLETDEVEIAWKKTKANYKTPSHFHKKGVEITICIKGKAIYQIKKHRFTMKKGDFLLVYPQTVISEFITLSDSEFIVIKAPSIPDDKFLTKK